MLPVKIVRLEHTGADQARWRLGYWCFPPVSVKTEPTLLNGPAFSLYQSTTCRKWRAYLILSLPQWVVNLLASCTSNSVVCIHVSSMALLKVDVSFATGKMQGHLRVLDVPLERTPARKVWSVRSMFKSEGLENVSWPLAAAPYPMPPEEHKMWSSYWGDTSSPAAEV